MSAVPFIIATEFCERFTFYGIKAVLLLYLTSLGLTGDTATATIHAWISVAYFSSLFGAFLADGVLGRYKTILYLCIVYCVGSLVLCWGSIQYSVWYTAIGLLMLALGTGGIKPCVSAFGAEQVAENMIPTFFGLFYFSINSGSLLSMILTPLLRRMSCNGMVECYPLAFGIPACLMFVSTLLFALGNKYYVHTIHENPFKRVFAVIRSAIINRFTSNEKMNWMEYAALDHPPEIIQDVKRLVDILVVFIPLPMFWALYDQMGSRWTIQARQMNLHVFGFRVTADQIAVLNAVLILILIPMSRAVYRRITISLQNRMILGMLFAAASFLCAALVQFFISQHPPVMWQIPQYILVTIAEILFSLSGLEFAYTHAPLQFRSICQAVWLLTVAVGNIYVVIVAALAHMEPMREFLFFGTCMLTATLVFYLNIRSIQ